jgi:hypothetical protein
VFCALVCSTFALSQTCLAFENHLCHLPCQDDCGCQPGSPSILHVNQLHNKVADIIASNVQVMTCMKQETGNGMLIPCPIMHMVEQVYTLHT